MLIKGIYRFIIMQMHCIELRGLKAREKKKKPSTTTFHEEDEAENYNQLIRNSATYMY